MVLVDTTAMGTLVLTAGDDVKVWDSSNGFQLIQALSPHHGHSVSSVTWNSEGKYSAISKKLACSVKKNVVGPAMTSLEKHT